MIQFAVRSSGSVLSVCQFTVRLQFMVHAGRLVRPVVQLLVHGSVVQSVYTVCIIAVADQYYPDQPTKHASRLLGFFTQPIYKVYMYIIGQNRHVKELCWITMFYNIQFLFNFICAYQNKALSLQHENKTSLTK